MDSLYSRQNYRDFFEFNSPKYYLLLLTFVFTYCVPVLSNVPPLLPAFGDFPPILLKPIENVPPTFSQPAALLLSLLLVFFLLYFCFIL